MTRPGRRSLITLTGRKKKIRLTQAHTQTQIQSPQTRSISIFICSWLLIVLAAVSLSRHRVQRSSSSCRTGVRYEGHVSPVAGTYTKPDRSNKCLQLKKVKRMERRRKEKSNKRSNLKGREVLVRQKHHGEICKTCIQTRCFAVKCIVRVVKAGPQKNDVLEEKKRRNSKQSLPAACKSSGVTMNFGVSGCFLETNLVAWQEKDALWCVPLWHIRTRGKIRGNVMCIRFSWTEPFFQRGWKKVVCLL